MDRKFDILILTLYPIIAAIFSFFMQANALSSVFIFFGIPSLYLPFRQPRHIKKAALFSLVGVPALIFVDYIAHITETWLVPNSIFPFRLFGYVTMENVLWIFFHLYLVVIYFEHFIVHHLRDKLVQPRTKYLFLIIFSIFTFFIALYYFSPNVLYLRYWYVAFGSISILLPVVLQRLAFPKVFAKLLKVVPFFIYLLLIYEITALKLNWWSFPGQEFIGWVILFDIVFPLEEMVFWIILFSLSILSYYEYFDENEK